MKTTAPHLIVAAISLLFVLSPAAAAPPEYSFEIYAGNYDPEPDFLDDDATFGLRFGRSLTERVTLQGTLGFFETDGELREGSTTARIDADIMLIDLSLGYIIGSDERRLRGMVYGGIGGSFTNIDATVTGPNLTALVEGLDSDSLTLHVGVGPTFRISEKLYLRLASRFRWFESRGDDEIDREIALSLGWSFHGP